MTARLGMRLGTRLGRRLRQRLRRRLGALYDRAQTGEDRGVTLMELVVGMGILSVFLGVFTGAIVMLNQSSNRAIALTSSSGQADRAFARLDKSLHYASAITTPGRTGTGWYVEFLTSATATSTGVAVQQQCTQLRLNATTQQLEARSWAVSATNTAVPANPVFVPWADGVTNGTAAIGSATVPFVFSQNPPNTDFEQLRVQLSTTNGSPPVLGTVNATFTALNSTAASAQGASAIPICNQTGARP